MLFSLGHHTLGLVNAWDLS